MWKLTISGEYQTKALGCGWLKLHVQDTSQNPSSEFSAEYVTINTDKCNFEIILQTFYLESENLE